MPARLNWRLVLCVFLLGGVYAGAHLRWYLGTPLGRVPVLDQRENLQLAQAIAAGTLLHAAFYRAMGYPLLLAGLECCGVAPAALFTAGLWLGALLHALTAALAALLAWEIFRRETPAALAGLFCALNPVLVHFATQVQDTALGTVLFLGGLLCLLRLPAARRPGAALAGASVLWALAAVVRPNFLLVWLALPAAWLVLRPAAGRPARGWPLLAGALAAGVFILILPGLWQKARGAEFRLLPWQGAYNLWAANRPGANGRFFSQTIFLRGADPGAPQVNPAEIESIALFARETGARPPFSIGAVNAHWTGKFHAYVRAHPLAWAGLLLRKTYYLFNNVEQYNNETYAFQKARSPWLRPNPLGWGLLLVLAVGGGLAAFRSAPRPALATLLAAAAVGVSIVLFYASARFRVPLAALLGVFAGGIAVPWRDWLPATAAGRALLAASALLAAGVTFSRFAGVNDPRTVIQDHLLLASAAQRTGDDAQAWAESNLALALAPGRADALELAVSSYFNLLLAGRAPAASAATWTAEAREVLGRPGDFSLRTQVSAALALWRAADRTAAAAAWRRIASAESDHDNRAAAEALGALALARAATPAELQKLRALALDARAGPLALMARQQIDPAGFSRWLAETRQPALGPALQRAAGRLFSNPPP